MNTDEPQAEIYFKIFLLHKTQHQVMTLYDPKINFKNQEKLDLCQLTVSPSMFHKFQMDF